MAVIDFHTHVLPGIDDGSRHAQESLDMLKLEAEQGIDSVVATSHFYAKHDRISSFLNRRQDSFETLQRAISQEYANSDSKSTEQSHKDLPRIYLGAEVAFFDGISRADDIHKLTVEGTNLLLLEMPFGRWTSGNMEEVRYLVHHSGLQIMLVHLERFLLVPENKKKIYELLELPCILQVNAGSMLKWKTRGQSLKLFKTKGSGILGSDAHGTDYRAPNLAAGREVLAKKLGQSFLDEMDRLGAELLADATVPVI